MSILAKAKAWAKAVNRDVFALWMAARDPRTPWYAKALAGLVAAYALSPIDLIPDFIPVLGYVDDLILVPLGIAAAVALVPKEVMAECRTAAARRSKHPRSLSAACAIVLIWLLAILATVWMAEELLRLSTAN